MNALRLSQLAGAIQGIVEEVFYGKAFWVIADVTSHSYKVSSHHHYFDLVEKDTSSSTLLAKFATRAWTEGSEQIAAFEQTTGQTFTNGINVLVLVSISYHPAYGLQLTLHDIDTNFTLGTLEKQKQATLQRLLTENPEHIAFEDEQWQTYNQSLPLNIVIQRIAVISSSTSAGYEDFVHTLTYNQHGYQFQVDNYFTVVQGESNAKLVVEKLIEIYTSTINYDAIIIIRGGGAQTDFLLFEQYNIGRAIARFPIPIITGIGHQKNETVADLMAHTAVKTPTQAAEFILSHNRGFLDNVQSLEKTIIIHAQRLLAGAINALTEVNYSITNNAKDYLSKQQEALRKTSSTITNKSRSLLFTNKSKLIEKTAQLTLRPKLTLYTKSCELESAAAKLQRSSNQYLKEQQIAVKQLATIIKLMAPENILRKGFAMVKGIGNNQTVKAEDIAVGQDISLIFAQHEITAAVTTKQSYNGTELNLSTGL